MTLFMRQQKYVKSHETRFFLHFINFFFFSLETSIYMNIPLKKNLIINCSKSPPSTIRMTQSMENMVSCIIGMFRTFTMKSTYGIVKVAVFFVFSVMLTESKAGEIQAQYVEILFNFLSKLSWKIQIIFSHLFGFKYSYLILIPSFGLKYHYKDGFGIN